ncbi:pentatricopeptide repeat-containing protein [Acrasis kona]|uniref:Pentatricopeptide repeat-containing protein n=1 Tax=Acrasis kona TaxID=1008807 RepID=A0AAW2Z4L4_9EUKA
MLRFLDRTRVFSHRHAGSIISSLVSTITVRHGYFRIAHEHINNKNYSEAFSYLESVGDKLSPKEYTVLLRRFCDLGNTKDALTLYNIYPRPNIIMHRTMVQMLLRVGLEKQAMTVIKEMNKSSETKNDINVFTSMIVYLSRNKSRKDEVFELIDFVRDPKNNFEMTPVFLNAIAKVYLRYNRLDESKQAIDKILENDGELGEYTVSYIVEVMLKTDGFPETINVLQQLHSKQIKLLPSQFNIVLHHCFRHEMLDKIPELLSFMLTANVIPDDFTASTLIQGYNRRGMYKTAIDTYVKLVSMGLKTLDAKNIRNLVRSVLTNEDYDVENTVKILQDFGYKIDRDVQYTILYDACNLGNLGNEKIVSIVDYLANNPDIEFDQDCTRTVYEYTKAKDDDELWKRIKKTCL